MAYFTNFREMLTEFCRRRRWRCGIIAFDCFSIQFVPKGTLYASQLLLEEAYVMLVVLRIFESDRLL